MDFEIINPATTLELLGTINELQSKHFRFGAGYSDLLMELKKKPEENLVVINLSQIKDTAFTGLTISPDHVRMGAMVTAHKIVMNEQLNKDYPVLHQAALTLASTQIRQVATVGGNLCTASPSGDIACALVALIAHCEIMDSTGKTKSIPITDFFLGPRKTVIKKNEFLNGVLVSANNKLSKNIYSAFLKIGTRRSMECSVVSLAYHIQTDDDGDIIHAGVAIGASAPTIRFAKDACDYLIGKRFDHIHQKEKEEFATKVLSYADPITDIRATAWYRKEVLYNLSKSIFE